MKTTKATEVTISLTRDAEFELREKFGWRCERTTLITKAIEQAIKGNGTPKVAPVKPARKPRAKKGETKAPQGEHLVECAGDGCNWTGPATLPGNCPTCGYYLREIAA